MDHSRLGDRPPLPQPDRPPSPSPLYHPTTGLPPSSAILPPSIHGASGHVPPPPPPPPTHSRSHSHSHSYPYSPSHAHSRSHGTSSTMMGYSSAALHGPTPNRHPYSTHPAAISHPHASPYYRHAMPPQSQMHHAAPLSDYALRRPSIPPLSTFDTSARSSNPPPPPPPPPIHSAHHHPAYGNHGPVSPLQKYPRYEIRPLSYEPSVPGISMPPQIGVPGSISGRSRVPSPQTPQGSPLIAPEHPQLPQSPFRFNTTLETQTSMVQRDDEIPVTYLNKSQKYRLIIGDSQPPPIVPPHGKLVQYRTSIRVTFDDAGQRREPAAAWDLWKETRDTRADDNPRPSGSLLRALEFIDEGDRRRPFGTDVQLQQHQFDSFTVIWTPTVFSRPQCAINVRFNFLSTDFSQTKGVKGVAVRVVAKTSIYNPRSSAAGTAPEFSELSYCKAKVFRDHGAERKLAIDSDRVRRNIEKIRHSLRASERGLVPRRKDRVTKRLRNVTRGRSVRRTVINRALEEEKYDPADDDLMDRDDDGYASPTESLQMQLRNLEQMSRSVSNFTVFILPGDEEDDPDLHPVRFYDEHPRGGSSDRARNSTSNVQTSPWAASDVVAGSASDIPVPSGPSHVINNTLNNTLDAVDVDRTYRPPPPGPRAVACFYFRRQTPSSQGLASSIRPSPERSLFRATYLMQRSVDELRRRIGAKWSAKTLSARVIYINHNGLEVAVDQDFVQQMPEGQAYDIDFRRAPAGSTPKMLPSAAAVAGKAALPALLNAPTPEEEAAAAAAADEIYEIRMVPVGP